MWTRDCGGVKLGARAAHAPDVEPVSLDTPGMAGRRVEAGEEEGEGVELLLLLLLLVFFLTQGWLVICSRVGRSSGVKESSH